MSDSEKRPTRPAVLYDPSVGWADSGDMVSNNLSAVKQFQNNNEALQQATAGKQAAQDAKVEARPPQPFEAVTLVSYPQPASGTGLERPTGTFDQLKHLSPAAEPQAAPEAEGAAEMTDSKAAKLARLADSQAISNQRIFERSAEAGHERG